METLDVFINNVIGGQKTNNYFIRPKLTIDSLKKLSRLRRVVKFKIGLKMLGQILLFTSQKAVICQYLTELNRLEN